jgi:hypothetical protein
VGALTNVLQDIGTPSAFNYAGYRWYPLKRSRPLVCTQRRWSPLVSNLPLVSWPYLFSSLVPEAVATPLRIRVAICLREREENPVKTLNWYMRWGTVWDKEMAICVGGSVG